MQDGIHFAHAEPVLPHALQAGESLSVAVSLLGDAPVGLAEDALTITTDVQEPMIVEIRANVTDAPQIEFFRETSEGLTGFDLGTPLDLGHVLLGQQKEVNLVAVNTGLGALRIDDVRFAAGASSRYVLGALEDLPRNLTGSSFDADAGVLLESHDGGLGTTENALLFKVIYQATDFTGEAEDGVVEVGEQRPQYSDDVAAISLKALTVNPVLDLSPDNLTVIYCLRATGRLILT